MEGVYGIAIYSGLFQQEKAHKNKIVELVQYTSGIPNTKKLLSSFTIISNTLFIWFYKLHINILIVLIVIITYNYYQGQLLFWDEENIW